MAVLQQELAALERAIGGDEQLVDVHRLHDEVVRAELEARDRGLHVGRAGEHDDGGVGVGLAHLLEQIDAAHDRHLEVGDGQRGARLADRAAEHLDPSWPSLARRHL